MAQPTASDVRIDPVLTNMSIRYSNSGLFIADQVFPLVRVETISGKYYEFDRDEWFRDEAQGRAPGAASEGGGFKISDSDYSCEEQAYHTMLPDEVKDNADAVLRIENAKVDFVTQKILLKLERRVAALCHDDSEWEDVTLSGTDQWSDYDNSDPLSDIQTGVSHIEDETGMPPNTMVLPIAVWRKLQLHPDITDRMAVTNTRISSLEILAELTGINKILIGKSLYNDAKRGAADDFKHVWGKNVWIGHVANSPALETPSAGYVFYWPRNGQMRGVRRWRDEDHHSDKIEAFMNFDEKITADILGYLIQDAVA